MQFITLTDNNVLKRFDSETPDRVTTVAVTGVEGTLLGIDTRPANGLVYGVSTTNGVYTIDPNSGAATFISTLSEPFEETDVVGFDFNPVADRLRLVGSDDRNFRINVDTGEVIVDGDLAYVDGDANVGADPNITAVGYTNSFAGTTSTELYDIDEQLDILALQNPPNDGGLETIGSLGIDFSTLGGLDIVSSPDGTNDAFAVSDETLYAIDLETGAATELGEIGGDVDGAVTQSLTAVADGIVVPPVAANSQFIALAEGNTLLRFDPSTPEQTTTLAVTGVEGTLLGIDTRPANGLVYGVSTTNDIYTINPNSGAATFISTLSEPFEETDVVGFDFNPVADRLRLVGGDDRNFRINIDTGEVIVDGDLAYVDGDANVGADPSITAVGYTNSFAGTTSTELYDIDEQLDILALQNPPNDGGLETIGSLGIDFDTVGGLEIVSSPDGTNAAFAVSDETLYGIDLSTGQAIDLGEIGSEATFQGLTAVPAVADDGNNDFVIGTPGADTILGGIDIDAIEDIILTGAGDDTIDLPLTIDAGNNLVMAGSGADTLFVSGNDIVSGSSGTDIIVATDSTGGNRASGGAGDDLFLLGNGRDIFIGGAGNDTFVVGEGGGNILSGGAGTDTFVVLSPGDVPASANIIADFGSEDLLSTPGTAFGDLEFAGSDIVIEGNTIATLSGFDATTLTAANFV